MGIRISKDHLHPSVIESITSLIGDLSQLETTAKGNAVEAINELLANGGNKEELEALIAEIAEGKGLIANAVGEPLTAEDTFSAMSNDINSLLSTFKTNMMNNGVTVESSDKFKSLIDKIATMVEEGEGKGIQFASGTCGVSTGQYIKVTDLGFTPSIIIVSRVFTDPLTNTEGHFSLYCPLVTGNPNNYIVGQTTSDSLGASEPMNLDGSDMSKSYISGDSFQIGTLSSSTSYQYNWVAIGVGEEDTTLRDSLASILTEEGVEVTEEDGMASLITKVDNEFDNINEELANALIDKGVKLEGNESTDELIQKIINDMSNIIYSGTQYTLVSGESTGYTATNSTAYVSNSVTIPTLPTGIIKDFRLNMSVTHTNRLGTTTNDTGYIQVYIERNSEIIEYIYDNAGPQSTTNQVSIYNYNINNIQENDKIYYRVKSTTSNDIYTYAITSITITYDIFEV